LLAGCGTVFVEQLHGTAKIPGIKGLLREVNIGDVFIETRGSIFPLGCLAQLRLHLLGNFRAVFGTSGAHSLPRADGRSDQ